MTAHKIKILIIGANGLLGSTLIRYFDLVENIEVYGTTRFKDSNNVFSEQLQKRIFSGIDITNTDVLVAMLSKISPDVVINCVGIVKQLVESNKPLTAIPINSVLPHRLANLSNYVCGARFIHFSTDCVFSGLRGNYSEEDIPDACDLYGRSKLLGEVSYPKSITLRTSLIGHEIKGSKGLINWFLAQEESVQGFTRAIFSGLPTVEIARVIEFFILPNLELEGLYHLSVNPISKYDLLKIVKDVYGKEINIIPDDSLILDRSLDSSRLRKMTGFFPKPWTELIQDMHNFG